MSLNLSLFFRTPTLPPLPNILPNIEEKIDKIIDDEIIATKDDGTRRYLIHWKKCRVMIHGLTEMTCNGLTRVPLSDTRAFQHLTQRGRVLSHPRRMMRASSHAPEAYVIVGRDASHICGSISWCSFYFIWVDYVFHIVQEFLVPYWLGTFFYVL